MRPDSATSPHRQFVVDEEHNQARLDSFLVSQLPEFSRAKIQRAIGKGQALVEGAVAKSSARLQAGQQVDFRLPLATPVQPIPQEIPLDILYEDDWLIAVNKPPAMVVHPAKGHWSGTLTSALAYHFGKLSTLGGESRPGIVHRLDRDTSGVILVARHDDAHAQLARQFEQRTVAKEYWAMVTPGPDRDRDLIDQPIGAHPYQREKKAIRHQHATSKPAQSFYEVKERFRGFAVVSVQPKTGRTHQIRVHLAHIGSPVLCDRLYGGRAEMRVNELDRKSPDDSVLLERQALHARRIEIRHPQTGEPLIIEAPLPPDLSQTREKIAELRSLSG